MNRDVNIPHFANEAEEAEWWFRNRETLEQDFADAARAGRLRLGSTALRRARQAAAKGKTLRIALSDEDLGKIRELAGKQGQGEEETAAGILHRALQEK